MSIQTEIRLRLPRPKVAPRDENGYQIDIPSVRFVRRLDVSAVPKVDDALQLSTSQYVFPAVVSRVAWDDAKSMFVVECRYTQRPAFADHVTSIMSDPEWTLTPLL